MKSNKLHHRYISLILLCVSSSLDVTIVAVQSDSENRTSPNTRQVSTLSSRTNEGHQSLIFASMEGVFSGNRTSLNTTQVSTLSPFTNEVASENRTSPNTTTQAPPLTLCTKQEYEANYLCPDGLVMGLKCLMTLGLPMTWNSAYWFCQQRNEVLMEPRTWMEASDFNRTMRNINKEDEYEVWVGLKKAADGNYRWLEEPIKPDNLPWAHGHPNNAGRSKKCYPLTQRGLEVTHSCESKSFYCETPADTDPFRIFPLKIHTEPQDRTLNKGENFTVTCTSYQYRFEGLRLRATYKQRGEVLYRGEDDCQNDTCEIKFDYTYHENAGKCVRMTTLTLKVPMNESVEMGKYVCELTGHPSPLTSNELEGYYLNRTCNRISVTQVAPCRENELFIKSDKKCVWFGEILPFEMASEYCLSQNGTLVRVDSNVTDSALLAFMESYGEKQVWLGLKYHPEEKIWLWIQDSERQATYFNWMITGVDPIEPKCACKHNSGSWIFSGCQWNRTALCERPMDRPDIEVDLIVSEHIVQGFYFVISCAALNLPTNYLATVTMNDTQNVTTFQLIGKNDTKKVSYVKQERTCLERSVLTLSIRAEESMYDDLLTCCIEDPEEEGEEGASSGETICSKPVEIKVNPSKPTLTMNADIPPSTFYVGSDLMLRCAGVSLGSDHVSTWLAKDNVTGVTRFWHAHENGLYSTLQDMTIQLPDMTIQKIEAAKSPNRTDAFFLTVEILIKQVTTELHNWAFSCFLMNLKPEQLDLPEYKILGATSLPIQVQYVPVKPVLHVNYYSRPSHVPYGQPLEAQCVSNMSSTSIIAMAVEAPKVGLRVEWHMDTHSNTLNKSSQVVNATAWEDSDGQPETINATITYERELLNIFQGVKVTARLSTDMLYYLDGATIQCYQSHAFWTLRADSDPLAGIYLATPPDLREKRISQTVIFGTSKPVLQLVCNAHVATNGTLTWAVFTGPLFSEVKYWHFGIDKHLVLEGLMTKSKVTVESRAFYGKERKPTITSELKIVLEDFHRQGVVLCCSFNFTGSLAFNASIEAAKDPNCKSYPLSMEALQAGELKRMLIIFINIGFFVLLLACFLITFTSFAQEKQTVTLETTNRSISLSVSEDTDTETPEVDSTSPKSSSPNTTSSSSAETSA